MGGEPYLVHNIDKGLSFVPAEVTNQLDFVLAGKNIPNERDDFIFVEVACD